MSREEVGKLGEELIDYFGKGVMPYGDKAVETYELPTIWLLDVAGYVGMDMGAVEESFEYFVIPRYFIDIELEVLEQTGRGDILPDFNDWILYYYPNEREPNREKEELAVVVARDATDEAILNREYIIVCGGRTYGPEQGHKYFASRKVGAVELTKLGG